MSIGLVHANTGEYDKAMDYYSRSLVICEELGDKAGIGYSYYCFGMVHYYTGNYNKAADQFKKSLNIQKEIGVKQIELFTTTYLYLSYTHLSKDYDEKDIHSLIKEAENIEFEENFRLYQLLDDTSYLETAYKQIKEKASEMEEKLGTTFLSYPLPTAIVEEWEKIKEH
jgi:tetratricopeptide (TPR) repeat protein